MTGITAAVVGVIAKLAVYFAAHTLFSITRRITTGRPDVELPDVSSIRPTAVALMAIACVLVFRLRWSVLRVLGTCAALGLAAGLAGLAVA